MIGKKPAPGLADTPPEDLVHLKPFLGMRPGVYLAGLYALAILGILFFLLLFPGLFKPGSVLALNSEPQGAAVRIDGVTLGATPCELFVPKGGCVVEMVLPGFAPFRREQAVPGQVFGSLFFPRRIAISADLEAPDPLAAFVPLAAEYAQWSFTGEPTPAYQIPQALSEGAYRVGPAAAADPAVREETLELVKAAARFGVTKAALRDLLRAQFLADSGGLAPSPLALLHGAAGIVDYLSENPGAAAWLAETLPAPAGLLEGSSWYRETIAAAAALSEESGRARGPVAGETISLGRLVFRRLPAGEFIQRDSFPRRVRLESFYVAATGISGDEWGRFLLANPRWRRDNAPALIAEGLASPGYLDEPINPPGSGVPGISWHAAEAYCEWLTASLPPSLSGWEVRLPREAEWEYAAPLFWAEGASRFWEWCLDPYAPLNYLSASEPAMAALSSPERSLRGGSWINPAGTVGMETRASLAPASSSPFVSFRPVIAPKPASGGRP